MKMTKDVTEHKLDIMNSKNMNKNISMDTCKNVLYGICTIGIATSLLQLFSGLACLGGGIYALATETILSLISAETLLIVGISVFLLGLFNIAKNLLGLKGADNPDKILPALVLGVVGMLFSGGNLVNGFHGGFELFPLIIMSLTFILNAGFCFCTVMIHLANREAKTATK